MKNYLIFLCFNFAFCAEKKDKDVNKVLTEHLGPGFKTSPFKGQLSTIHDARTLNCNFPSLAMCCWFNTPKPVDDIDWVQVETPVHKIWFRNHYGAKAKIPEAPFLVASAASQSAAERAILVSCAIPCQAGAGQITMDHWLDDVELNICRVPVSSMTVVEPCANLKGTGTTTVMVDSFPEPYYIAIMATGFGPDGLAVIDNILYGARIPSTCPA